MRTAEKLTTLLAGIGSARRTFLSQISPLSQKQFDFKPGRDDWSVGEVAHHVALTERAFQTTLKELLDKGGESGSAIKNIGIDELALGPSMIPQSILQSVLQLPGVRAPMSLGMTLMPGFIKSFILANPIMKIRTAPMLEPEAGLPREKLLGQLKSLRAATLALVEPLADKDLSRYQWGHPLFGTRDIYSTLQMLADHDQRHLIQIERIKRARAFPHD
ncbi:MAG TPA: DinB family protein [Bryobacteraceae bacterium]|nr:DinB family protein [Bryobacteraceae bacterium]